MAEGDEAGAPAGNEARPELPDAVGQHATSFEVPASDVLVRGRGSIEDMLRVLHDIAHTCGHEAQNPALECMRRAASSRRW